MKNFAPPTEKMKLMAIILCFLTSQTFQWSEMQMNFDILLPILFRPTVRKNCSSDQEKF